MKRTHPNDNLPLANRFITVVSRTVQCITGQESKPATELQFWMCCRMAGLVPNWTLKFARLMGRDNHQSDTCLIHHQLMLFIQPQPKSIFTTPLYVLSNWNAELWNAVWLEFWKKL